MTGFSTSQEGERWVDISRTLIKRKDLSGTTLVNGSSQSKGYTESTGKPVLESPP